MTLFQLRGHRYCAASALVAMSLACLGCCHAADAGAGSPSSSASAPASHGISSDDSGTAAVPGPLFGAGTYAIVAGVLQFADPSITPFSAHNRKDQELYDLLLSRGVPRQNTSLLLDENLTAGAFRTELERVAKSAAAGSTMIVYYAGHGARASYDGSTSFLTYDSGGPGGEAISVDEIAVTLIHAFRGARVVFLADCCYSGALQKAAEQLRSRGVQAVTLTSADASNASTGNWTFTQSIIDGIRGEPLVDRNGDGVVVLQELAEEVAEAMKFREHQRAGFARYDVPADLPIATVSAPRPEPSAAPDPYAPGRYFEAYDGVSWRPVRVLQTRGDLSVVRFYHYSDAMDVPTPHAELRPTRFASFPVGASLRVHWGKKLWDATVLEVDGDFHKITYPGWPSYWDEWILSDRIASPVPAPKRPQRDKRRVPAE